MTVELSDVPSGAFPPSVFLAASLLPGVASMASHFLLNRCVGALLLSYIVSINYSYSLNVSLVLSDN